MYFISACAEITSSADPSQNTQPSNINTNTNTNINTSTSNNNNNLGPRIKVSDEYIKEFSAKFKQRFSNFMTLNPALLAEAVGVIPAQGTLWGCGLHQCEAAVEIAHKKADHDRHVRTNFSQVGSYPLAVDFNVNTPGIKDLLGFLGQKLPTDAEGNFRVGALPHDLAKYINNNLQGLQLRATAKSQASLQPAELVATVKHNLDLEMPTPVLYIVDKNNNLAHVYSIVGYNNKDFLILDTVGDGIDRLVTKNINDFIANMDSSSIISLVNIISLLDNFKGLPINIREEIKASGGKLAEKTAIDAWRPYSFIKFDRI
jgi:hypothetical protein